jgi:hypothetical protein
MFLVNDQADYLAKRHAAEVAAAKTATSRAARLAHLELAGKYLAASLKEQSVDAHLKTRLYCVGGGGPLL